MNKFKDKFEFRVSKFNEIKRRFEWQRDSHKQLGDYINLCYAIKGRKYNKKDLHKAFLKLVNREEFDWSERNDYIEYLSTI